MGQIHFRVDGLTEENVRRWRKRTRPTAISAKIVGWLAAAVVTVYAINYPGQIKITPVGGGTSTTSNVITVKGTVENTNVGSITLNVNGYPRRVSVKNGAFSSTVPMVRGENIIQASVGGVSSNIMGASNIVKVTAKIPPMDIWTELTWDGPGDVDLHLYLPNGEHCFYKRKETQSGARLDIDNKVRDGPEHILLENAIPGEYRLTVLYYRSASRPPRPVPWQVTVRLRDGEIQRSYAGVLRKQDEEQPVDKFAFP